MAGIVDRVSDPSTDSNREVEPQEYLGYPFKDWSDLYDGDKMARGTTAFVDLAGDQSEYEGVAWNEGLKRAARVAVASTDSRHLKQLVQGAVESAKAMTIEVRKRLETAPVYPGHLRAEGAMLRIAKEAVSQGNRMPRKVTFSEPVKAFTCLSSDRIGKGGDMLTAVTICDTVKKEFPGIDGPMKTVYEAKAVTT